MTNIKQPLVLDSQYREYLWGGYRLRPGKLTAEVWMIYEDNVISSGPLKGMTLGEATRTYPQSILGEKGSTHSRNSFPLLIKILDCHQWLSLQVHPDDDFAVQLEGPGKQGKTEAWYIIDAEPGAKIIGGIRPGVDRDKLVQAIGSAEILELVEWLDVVPGEFVFMPARTIHALGPGLLVYEIQQSSDITYRVYDWDRPPVSGRALHLEQARLVSDPGVTCMKKKSLGDQVELLIESPYFNLEKVELTQTPLSLNTKNETFHALTVISGSVNIWLEGEGFPLENLQSVVVPAAAGFYTLEPKSPAVLLKAYL